jgi:plasmid maintenance system antidote protein VapI
MEVALARPARLSATSIDIDLVRRQKTAGAALAMAVHQSGLEAKEVSMPLGIDAGYFSNIMSGKASLKADLIEQFCTLVGNTIYPEWIAWQVGCTLVLTRSEAERRAKQAELQVDLLQAEVKVLRDLILRAGRTS